MTPAARSVNIFGTYLLVLAAVLLVSPNTVLQTFGLQPTAEVWIRVVGMLLVGHGIFYRTAAQANLASFFLATVLIRASVLVFFGIFVLAGWVEWPLMLFGVFDAAGAAWTWFALRQSRATGQPT